MWTVWNPAAEGRLTPVIGQRFALADAPAAHQTIESRAATGKTILRAVTHQPIR